MLLDERSATLLTLLQHSPTSKMSELELLTGLTRRQLQYAIKKANDWLSFQGYRPIKYDRLRGYSLSEEIRVEELTVKLTKRNYTFSETEREKLFYLLLLLEKEELSVYHFQSVTGLSRNTVLADLRKLKEKGRQLNLQIEYSKQLGYVVIGDSMSKRYAIELLVSEVLNSPNSKLIMECVWKERQQQFHQIRFQLEQVEKKLDITFTDERLNELSLLFLCSDQLIEKGDELHSEEDWIHFAETEEYRMVEQMIDSDGFMTQWNQTEKLYATLHLLSMNRTKDMSLLQENETIYSLLREIAEEFERLAFVQFQDKEALYQQLYIHFKPAYHRLKYGLPQANPIAERVKQVYPELYHLSRKSLHPLEKQIGYSVSEDEAAYFAIHFGGWLRKQGTRLDDRKRAIVVCPNGVGISNILIYTLREFFPDILFLDVLSVRAAAEYTLPYDLVFSTVHLRTEALLFIVPTILGKQEKQVLRQQVMQELYGFATQPVDVADLLKIIEKHATIHEFEELEKTLQASLYGSPKAAKYLVKEAEKPVLEELLTTQTTQLKSHVSDWKEAIHIATQPLVTLGTVEERYTEAMIKSIEDNGPYVVITPDVAIPHARPEEGVRSLSMSLLKLEQPVYFAPDKPVQLLIVLAASDSDSHLRALIQLTQLLGERSNIDELLSIDDKSKLLEKIYEYSKEETQ